ncbi:MFS general substrate transporter [Atractiella rhizophila]|nr:MFS general substrate transporter [Atractiella rhizophila]KAH8927672.1 MFS general substrate transporter [Atractiella rhizophila]
MSPLILIYILNYMDRNNVSAARLRGFEQTLHLNDTQYQTILSILYVGYILMQVPSNLFLNKIGKPSLYLPAAMIGWGVISCLTGIVNDYKGAVLTRFFLGFVEAAFFPGALFLLSKWYTKKELALRTAILYTGNLTSNAVNGLIASGILSNMEGVLGHEAWRWLFYIEGAITVFVAIISAFILPDFPETTSWLTPQERLLAQLRVAEDAGEADRDVAAGSMWKGFKMGMSDYKVHILAFLLTAQVVGLSFNAFFPTLTATLGYSRNITLLLCAPPWVFSAIVSFINAWHSDRTGEKFFHIIGPLIVGIIGCIIAMTTHSVGPRYFALFLLAQSYAGFIVFYSWCSSTIARPTTKRAVALAFINAFSQLGNIAGSYCWPAKWGFSYENSFGICISCFGFAIIGSFLFRLELKRLNRKLDGGLGSEVHQDGVVAAAKLEGIPVADALAARKGWRYMI